MKHIVTFLTVLSLGATVAFVADAEKKAERGQKRNPDEMFKKLDTNADGSISADEFKAGPMAQRNPAKADEMFKKRDKDGDGKLTLEEFKGAGHEKGDKKPEEKPAEAAK